MSEEPSLAKALMLRHMASIQRARSGRYYVESAQLRQPVRSGSPASRVGSRSASPSVSSPVADRVFAEILATATRRHEKVLRSSLAEARPVAQRSSLLLSMQGVPQQRWAPEMDVGSGEPTSLAEVPFSDLIMSAARDHGVSANLVAAVVKAESGFNPLAQSYAGAKGLMQLMEGTARSLGVSNIFDPAQNIRAGVSFLSSLLRRYNGDLKLALAAYNAGPGAVERYGGVPPYKETRDYVSKVLTYWQQFERSSAGA